MIEVAVLRPLAEMTSLHSPVDMKRPMVMAVIVDFSLCDSECWRV